MNSPRWIGLALCASVLALGLNWPVMKAGLAHVPPLWMVSLRFTLSAPVIAVLVLVMMRRGPRYHRGDLPVILGVALLQFAGQMGLATFALGFVPAGTASILLYTTPLWLLLFDRFVAGQRLGGLRVLQTVLSATGCATILMSSGMTGVWWPLGLILIASMLWATAMRLIQAHAWQGSVLDALFWQFLLAGAVTAVVAWALEGPFRAAYMLPPALWFMAFTGPVASGMGFGLMVALGRRLPPQRIALFSTATPLIGFVSSTLILGEPLQPLVMVGGALMLGALALSAVPSDP